VALSALRASGLDAVLLDTDAVTGAWREPYGQGGYRLAAAPPDAAAARALLADAQTTVPSPALTRTPSPDRLMLLRIGLILALFAAAAIAFLWRL
jgi:hypothetical protein